jgi:hypothetical protein
MARLVSSQVRAFQDHLQMILVAQPSDLRK